MPASSNWRPKTTATVAVAAAVQLATNVAVLLQLVMRAN